MGKKYAISDIHGCNNTFITLLENIRFGHDDTLYLLGDYIDRGPDSKGVLDKIMQLQRSGYNVTALRGNHEEMLLQSFQDPSQEGTWLMNGGLECLKSFGVDDVRAIPPQYISFLQSLEYILVLERHILVHAGVNFLSADPYADKQSMLWMRNLVVTPELTDKRIIIHGHTPVPREKIQSQIEHKATDVKIDIDNGCVFASRGEDYGSLCCLELDTFVTYYEKNKEHGGSAGGKQ